MIDSGAAANFVHEKVCGKLKVSTKYSAGNLVITLGDGSTVNLGEKKIFDLEIHHQDNVYNSPFYVIQHCCANMILGMPFLTYTEPEIKWNKGIVSWDNKNQMWGLTFNID